MRIKRRNGLVSALLGLVTCGLYHIFFWYQYGEDTNWVCRDDRKMTQNYIVAWILSWITCGIYGLYWTYQLASRLDQAGDRYNVHIESPVIFTIVMHIPFLSYFYACDVMNNFADAYERPHHSRPKASGIITTIPGIPQPRHRRRYGRLPVPIRMAHR